MPRRQFNPSVIQVCAHCEKNFLYHRKRKYCSDECCKEVNHPKAVQETKICAYKPCSKEFTPIKKHALYCSVTCCTYQSHGNTTIPGWRERARIKNAPKSAIYIKMCPITNQLFTTRRKNTVYHPSIDDKVRYSVTYKPKPKRKHICAKCHKESEVNNRTKSKYCPSCYDKEWRRMDKHKRRAIKRGNTAEFITPYIVFERDNWTCKQCGIPTPKELRGTRQWNAPELDHIIPVSKGGSHAMDNLQCLCKRCNINKGDKIIELTA